MTAEKILLKYGFDTNYALYTPDQGYMSIIDLMKEFAQIKCTEQRQMCAKNAKIVKEELSIRELENANYYGADYEDKYIVDIESIINTPEPEF